MSRTFAFPLTLALTLLCGACQSDPPAEDGGSPPAEAGPGEAPTSRPSEPAADGGGAGQVPGGLEALQPLLGKTPAEAEEWLKANRVTMASHPDTPVLTVRPVRIDGQDQAVTMDLRADRVNVVVEKGVISAIDSVG